MLEIKVSIEAIGLSNAIMQLAAAINKNSSSEAQTIYVPVKERVAEPTVAPAPTAQEAVAETSVAPLPAASAAEPTVAPAPTAQEAVAETSVAPAPTVPAAEPTVAPAPTAQEAVAETSVAPAPTVPAAEQTDNPPKVIDLDAISRAGASLVDMGKMDQLLEILHTKYKLDAVTQLSPDQYPAFAEELRALGASI